MKKYQNFFQKLKFQPIKTNALYNLMRPGELLVFEIRWHWIYYLMPALTYLLVIGAVLMVYRLAFAFRSRIIITNQRIIGQYGCARSINIEIRNSDVIEFEIIQNRLDLLINSGLLKLKTADEELLLKPRISNADELLLNTKMLFKNAQCFTSKA